MTTLPATGRKRLAAIRLGIEDRWMLSAIALLAVLVRCVVVLLTRHSYALVNDAADYSRLGGLIAGGHGFGISHFAPGGGPTAVRPPAFPLLLGLVYMIAGTHVVVARLVGALLGALAAVMVAVVVGQLGGDRRRVLAGGILAAVFPPMVIASTSVMSEALFVPLSLGVISAALAYRASGAPGWLALSGLLLGLGTLTRPIGAVLVLPAALIAFSAHRHPRRVLAGALAAALAILPCAAWEMRDVLVMHHVIPLTTQDGYFLAGSYNATSAADRSQPGNWIVPTWDPVMARIVAAHPHAQEVRLNDLLNSAARSYASSHPTYVLTVVGHNFLRLFDLTSLSFEQAAVYGEYGYGSSAGVAEYVATLAIIALAVIGVLRGGLRHWPAGVWLAPLLLLLITLPTRANPRFRAPIDPYLVIVASAALAGGGALTERSAPRLGRELLIRRRRPGGS